MCENLDLIFKITLFWDVTPCMVDGYQRLRGIFPYIAQGYSFMYHRQNPLESIHIPNFTCSCVPHCVSKNGFI
jgi:hypothetical protein